MKGFSFVLLCFAAVSSIFVHASVGPAVRNVRQLQNQSSPDEEIGITQYPQVRYLPEATQRLQEGKAPTWLLARVFHTDGSIKEVAKYFKDQGQKRNNPTKANALLKALLRDNWKIGKGLVRYAPTIFGVGTELRNSAVAENVEHSFGVIVLDDSIVRVHLITPYPASTDNNKLAAGTMIVLIRERLTKEGEGVTNESGAQGEKVYSGRDVTRKARVKSKPEPEGVPSGIYGVVVLRVVLSSSGKVTNIRAISGLPGGLTEASIEAAKKIKFEPAIKDGRYVSTHVQLEYHFLSSH